MSAAIQSKSSRRAVVLGGMASYIDGAIMVTLGLSVVFLAGPLHLSPLLIGWLFSAQGLAFAAGAVVGGRLGDVFGRKAVYSVDLLVLVAGLVVVMLAPTSAVLLVGLVITGFAMGVDVPTSVALVFEEAKTGRGGSAVALSQTLLLAAVAVTQGLGFLVAQLGLEGLSAARVLYLHPLVVAIVVWVMRRRVAESPAWERMKARPKSERVGPRALLSPAYLAALVGTALFFLLASTGPNALGQFNAYLVTTVAHSTVQASTVLGLVSIVVGLVGALTFQRIVDTRYRTAAFVAGSLLAVAGPIVPILAGFSFWSVAILLLLSPFGGVWAGEGLYKVWTQEIFRTDVRSTSQGLTYGVGRFASAALALVIPTLAAGSPTTLMLVLSGSAAVALIIGLTWIPRLPRDRAMSATPAEHSSASTLDAESHAAAPS